MSIQVGTHWLCKSNNKRYIVRYIGIAKINNEWCPTVIYHTPNDPTWFTRLIPDFEESFTPIDNASNTMPNETPDFKLTITGFTSEENIEHWINFYSEHVEQTMSDCFSTLRDTGDHIEYAHMHIDDVKHNNHHYSMRIK
jgi:hypothetical protein